MLVEQQTHSYIVLYLSVFQLFEMGQQTMEHKLHTNST